MVLTLVLTARIYFSAAISEGEPEAELGNATNQFVDRARWYGSPNNSAAIPPTPGFTYLDLSSPIVLTTK
jgi:hypothetical protein